jgi:hypothetical protein
VVLLATLIYTSCAVALSGMQLLHAWGTSIDDEELEETLVSMLKVCMLPWSRDDDDVDGVDGHPTIVAVFEYSQCDRKAFLRRIAATPSPLPSRTHLTTLWLTP